MSHNAEAAETNQSRDENQTQKQRSASQYTLRCKSPSYLEVVASLQIMAYINRCSSHDSNITLNSEDETYSHVTLATTNF